MMKSYIKYYISIIGIMLFLASCDFFDSTDQLPMYFNIDNVSLQTTNSQGFNTHKISDIDVFADGASVGVFNIPASVPVLKTKEQLDIEFIGVIRNNGIASNPIRYPFYKTQSFNFPFEENGTEVLELDFEYSEQSKQILVGDFEITNPFTVNYDNNPDIEFKRSGESEYGDFCGKITLDEAGDFFEKSTFTKIDRSVVFGGPVYLEMDYKNEIPFGIGVLKLQTGQFFVPEYRVALKKQEEWNKVYVELTEIFSDNQIEQFTILIGSSSGTSAKGSIWIDNLRIVHF